MQNIIIDDGFLSLLPELDKETYRLLEENLLQHGCLSPLILWNDILIDGHNMYEICTKHGIEFDVVSKEFESRENVLIWIISNQVSRRNLTPMQLSYFRGLHYRTDRKILTNASGKNQHTKVVSQNDQQPKNQSTVSLLSDKYRVSPSTIQRDANLSAGIDAIGEISPEAKRKILSGEVTISKTQLEALSAKPQEEIESVTSRIEDGTFKKKASASTALPDDGDAAGSIPAEIRQLEMIIRSITSDIFSGLRKSYPEFPEFFLSTLCGLPRSISVQ